MTAKQMVRSIAVRGFNWIKPMISDNTIIPVSGKPIHSYSQNSEDLIIDAILGCKPKGVYVDIGANDPEDFSNTKRFYDKGWNGICIEPHPEKFITLCQKRQRDIVLNRGVSEREGHLDFYMLDQDMISTFSKQAMENSKIERGAKVVDVVKISTERLDTILDTYITHHIDFMSIDVEGSEMEVLRSNNWVKYRPKVIIIEYNSNPSGISNFLFNVGYTAVYRNAENLIFVCERDLK